MTAKRVLTPEQREANRLRSLEWGRANREVAKRRAHAHYNANRERHAANAKAWKGAHPGLVRAYAQKHGKRSYGKRTALYGGEFHEVEVANIILRENGFCGICDSPVGRFHRDHRTPIAKGGDHSEGNIQLVHPSCNKRKHTKVDFKLSGPGCACHL